MNEEKLTRFVDQMWEDEVLPHLIEYIKIPNKSPAFDADWAAHGHMEQAVSVLSAWARQKISHLPDARLEVIRLAGRTPLILIDIPGASEDCVLLYGHLDKQPEMIGWDEGLGPWSPVRKDGKLYGRGGADDGYAIFAAITSIAALYDQRIAHTRAVVMIEASEESSSIDLPYYVDHLAERLGKPSLVVCLDSFCGNYEQLWLTTSLRGLCSGTLSVRVLEEGVHSGDASGVVPSSFRILRQLLSRIENEATGMIRPSELHAQIPADHVAHARSAAATLGEEIYTKFYFAPGANPMGEDPIDLVLNRSWRPQLAITGIEGLPTPANAGNVLLPYTNAKVSLRLPPSLNAANAVDFLRRLFEEDPPYGAEVRFKAMEPSTGWCAPPVAPWLQRSLAAASQTVFGLPPVYMGEGGSIPFMDMLGKRFPNAQFVVTGVLGPHSNAHGPNEFLDIQTAKRITAVVAHVLADHYARVEFSDLPRIA